MQDATRIAPPGAAGFASPPRAARTETVRPAAEAYREARRTGAKELSACRVAVRARLRATALAGASHDAGDR